MSRSHTASEVVELVNFHARQTVKDFSGSVRRSYNIRFFAMVFLLISPPVLSVAYFVMTPDISLWTLALIVVVGGLVSAAGLYPMLAFVHDSAHGLIPEEARWLRRLNYLIHPLLGVSTLIYKEAHLLHHAKLGIIGSDPQFLGFDHDQEASPVKKSEEVISKNVAIAPFSLKRFSVAGQALGMVMQAREVTLVMSFFSRKHRTKLYDELSFFGGLEGEGAEDKMKLPSRHYKEQRKLDFIRLLTHAAFISALFFSVGRIVVFQLTIAALLTGMLNTLRTSLEHSGAENESNTRSFNLQHSSNTDGGNNPLLRLIWYPAKWHAIHHAVPYVPFFMLSEVHRRCKADLVSVDTDLSKTELEGAQA